MKVREKPIIFEAYIWLGCADINVAIKKYDNNDHLCMKCHKSMNLHGQLSTKTCDMQVCEGDWVLKGLNGDMFAVSSDVLKEYYEFL